MRAKLLLSGAALFVLLLLAPARALACSCMAPGPPCQEFGSAAAVFVGTVTGVTERKTATPGDEIDWTPRLFRFTVVQPFLGVEGGEVEVATGRGGGDCGYGFRRGETYLVYAHKAREGAGLVTGICTRTRPASEASEDLDFLRGLAGRGPGVSIGVNVTRYAQSVKGGDSKPAGGLPDAKLVVEGGGGERREVSTDAEGRAQLSGLSPGTYKIRLLLPEELMTHKAEQEVTVADRGCATVLYRVLTNGRIGGRVSDTEGRAVAGVLVTLVDAEDPESELNYARYERTGEDGRYAFSGVPPGRYLLAVNLVRYPQPGDLTHAYPRTFYPGAAQVTQAEAVRLGAGESVRDRDLTVPPRRADYALNGLVVWADGRPVAQANISFRDLTYGDPGIGNGIQADEQGRFTIKGYQGQTLLIQASSGRQVTGDPRRDGPMERAEAIKVTLGEPGGPVRIVITRLR